MYESNGYLNGFHHLNDVIFWQELLQLLSLKAPTISWFPLIVLFLTTVSIVIIANCLFLVARRNNVPPLFSIAAILFLLTLLDRNLFWIHQNRVAFMMCGSAIIAAAALYGSSLSKRANQFLYSLVCFWFFAGLCFRPEAAAATLLLFLPGILIYYKSDWRAALNMFGGFCIMLAAFAFYYMLQLTCNSNFYTQLEPDVEYEIVDRRNVIPLASMKTLEDSAKYIAVANHWMLADVRKTTTEFIRSLVDKENNARNRFFFFLNPSKNGKRLLDAGVLISFITHQKIIFLFFLLLILFPLLNGNWKLSLSLAFFILSSVVFLSFSFSVDNYNRISQPLMALIAAWSIFLSSSQYPKGQAAPKKRVFLLLACITSTYYFWHLRDTATENKRLTNEENNIAIKMNSLMSNVKRKYVVFATLDFAPLNTGVFPAFTGYEGKQLLLIELVQSSANPAFLKKIGEVTNCRGDDFFCRMKFIRDNQSEVMLIGNKSRIALYDYYVKSVYDFDLNLSAAPSYLLFNETYYWLPE